MSQQEPSTGLTSIQRREFDDTGLLRLPAAIDRERVVEMRDRLWDELAKKYGIRPDAPETWPEGLVHGLQQPGKDGAFAGMAGPALVAALDDLFAPGGWRQPPRWGTPLVTFPFHDRVWKVPHQSWHLDVYGGLGLQREVAEVTVFAFLVAVVPKGGATVVVTGSHRLLEKYSANAKSKVRSADARNMLIQADVWLKDLCSEGEADTRRRRFMEEGAVVEGVPLKAVEITGEPGDVVIMHPGVLHTVSANIAELPRLVLRQGIYRAQMRQQSDARS